MLGHLITANQVGDISSNLVTGKNKILKRSVVANELHSLVLGVSHYFTVLYMLPPEALQTIMYIAIPGE